jgi:serine/threonine-protein kinase HipA
MRSAEIHVFGKRAGTLTENDDGQFTFVYDASYLKEPSAVAVSNTMPLRSAAYESNALFPFFDGLIPEGWLLDIAEKNWKLDGRDRMGLLLACCSSSIGAVSIRCPGDAPTTSPDEIAESSSIDGTITFDFPYTDEQINEMAKRLVASRISVCGVQPKLSVHLERESGGKPRITIVGFEGNYILKLPTKEYPEIVESECVAMTLARKCGIKTADFSLATISGGRRAYMTRRMDRTPHMRHMEDFCQLTERLTERKYFGSYEQIARKIRLYSSAGGVDAIRFFEVVLFSFLTGNSDMHLKNFSLLREEDGAWRLADAYDLLPARLLMPEDTEDLALTLNGKKTKIDGDDFLSFAKTIGLNDRQATRAVSRIVDALSANLDDTLAESPLSDKFASRFLRLVRTNMIRVTTLTAPHCVLSRGAFHGPST